MKMEDMREFFESFMNDEKKRKYTVYGKLNTFARKGCIVLAGSSLCEQFPIHEIMMAKGDSFPIYNRGVSGDVTDGLLSNLNAGILDLAPAKLFLNIGSNDIGLPDYKQEVLIGKYRNVLEQVIAVLPETKIHVLSWYPVNPQVAGVPEEQRNMMFATRTNASIEAANKALRELSDELGCTWVNVSDVLKDANGKLEESLTIEGIHMWPPAYERIYEVLRPYFIEN